ncbi:MAG: Cytochrome c biogenesis protein [candidate division WS6 bacterium 34_10]|uniref:Cytochrome c biogenesis protein n=1 Tax=candidate division WS6 bacterium 34_10 TaxID=1641389 RepID=A0A117M028_9BACT|nr:MAG: Cytochrome c biogenesis protein [candidate division WS6 bacterium 34_10]
MKNIIKNIVYSLFLLPLLLVAFSNRSYAQDINTDLKFATYFTGIGCPHCSVASPFIKNLIEEESNFVVIEYEVYEETRNATFISQYDDTYGIGLGIPVIFFDEETILAGDTPIQNNLQLQMLQNHSNIVQTPEGLLELQDFTLDKLPGFPRIYRKDGVAIRTNVRKLTEAQNEQILSFITSDLTEWTSVKQEGEIVTPEVVRYPGGNATYEHALSVNGWLLQWNGELVQTKPEVGEGEDVEYCEVDEENVCPEPISMTKILGLALADSVNPCAISVLLLMLIAITTYNPKDRKQILFSAGAFILAVVVMYMLYGFLIIKAFQFLQSITVFKNYLYKGLGIAALILGFLEIKDFIKYKPGGVGTEMPMFLRPKVQNVISKITSPIGAFGLGLFVTLFLLPCTIGPYVILGGMLSTLDYLKASPYLLLYNLIFVLPMIAISFIIFFGTKNIEDISDWRNTNVRKMHLISGILMCILGIVMFFGLL